MRFETIRLTDIHPYGNNPRRNDDAVNAVALVMALDRAIRNAGLPVSASVYDERGIFVL